MKTKRLRILGALLLALVLMPVPVIRALEEALPLQQEVGTNLLVNPGFEGIGKPSDNSLPNYNNWTRDTFTGASYGEIFTPAGWVTWWREGEFKRPECKVIPREHPFTSDPMRIHNGYYSGMCFTFFGKQDAGYYQVVRNIPAGSVVEGSFYAHAWACGEDTTAYSCAEPHSFYFQVGIDPTGGTDPGSANIVWSSPYFHYDTYGLVGPVQATVGQGGVATIFTRAYGKWQLKHNDAYMDDVTLKLVSVGDGQVAQPTEQAPPPTAEQPTEPDQPRPTSTPLPNGTIVHVVEEGDTLFGIAITYGVDLEELRRLNAGTLGPNDMLSIGQEIVVSGTGGAINLPTPTSVPQPTATPPAVTIPVTQTAQPPAQPTDPGAAIQPPSSGTASLCVSAFNDRNNDGLRQPESEELLPNATFNLIGTGGPAAPAYTSDGISEPHCFQNLAPGNYALRHTPPTGYGYGPADSGQWNVMLTANNVSALETGYMRGGAVVDANPNATADPAATEAPAADVDDAEPEEEEGGFTKTLNTILRVSGFLAAFLVVALIVVVFWSRRAV